MSKEIHPICVTLRELRRASGLSLHDMERQHGISAVLMGSYERGDRIPPLPKIDALLGMFGYKLTCQPIDTVPMVRSQADAVADLRAIATQLEMARNKQLETVPA